MQRLLATIGIYTCLLCSLIITFTKSFQVLESTLYKEEMMEEISFEVFKVLVNFSLFQPFLLTYVSTMLRFINIENVG